MVDITIVCMVPQVSTSSKGSRAFKESIIFNKPCFSFHEHHNTYLAKISDIIYIGLYASSGLVLRDSVDKLKNINLKRRPDRAKCTGSPGRDNHVRDKEVLPNKMSLLIKRG
jgi:hypothetical protein